MAEAKTLHITQVRSQIGRPADQGKTLKALGLTTLRFSNRKTAVRSGLFLCICFEIVSLADGERL